MSDDELRAECAKAAAGKGFAATAVKVVAEQMGVLSDDARAHYEAGVNLDSEGYKLAAGCNERVSLHKQAHRHYRAMAADVAARLGQ